MSQQRLSISELDKRLKEDPYYSDIHHIQDCCKYLRIKYTETPAFTDPDCFHPNPKSSLAFLKEQRETLENLKSKLELKEFDPVCVIHYLCALLNLNTYRPGEDEPTELFGSEYADQCDNDLEIRRDELETVLSNIDFPLPAFWFPEEPENTGELGSADKDFSLGFHKAEEWDAVKRLRATTWEGYSEQKKKEEELRDWYSQSSIAENGEERQKKDPSIADFIKENDIVIKDHKHPKEVIDLLRKAKPEIEGLYKGMMANRQEPDQDNGETYEGALKNAAEEWFNEAGNDYQTIKREHVLNSHPYFPNTKEDVPDLGHPRRNFQGKLCQVLIFNTFPNKYISDLSSQLKVTGFGIKALYDLLKSL